MPEPQSGALPVKLHTHGASEGNRTPVYRMAICRTNRYTTPAFGISVASTGPVCLCLIFLTYSQYLRVSTAKELFYLYWHMEPTTESGPDYWNRTSDLMLVRHAL